MLFHFENSLHPGEQRKLATEGINDVAKVSAAMIATIPAHSQVRNFSQRRFGTNFGMRQRKEAHCDKQNNAQPYGQDE
jgi:hypothetical protein